MDAFSQLHTTRKGDAGEQIVHRYLATKGYKPYCQALDGPYPFDCIAYSEQDTRLVIVEVKTYPRRYAYADTGIDLSDWSKYQSIATSNPLAFCLMFVDKFERAIYGADLRKLKVDRHGTGPTGRKVYFDLSRMELRRWLTADEVSCIPDPPGRGFPWSRYDGLRSYFPQPASLTI